jgi:hypothetical protein
MGLDPIYLSCMQLAIHDPGDLLASMKCSIANPGASLVDILKKPGKHLDKCFRKYGVPFLHATGLFMLREDTRKTRKLTANIPLVDQLEGLQKRRWILRSFVLMSLILRQQFACPEWTLSGQQNAIDQPPNVLSDFSFGGCKRAFAIRADCFGFVVSMRLKILLARRTAALNGPSEDRCIDVLCFECETCGMYSP